MPRARFTVRGLMVAVAVVAAIVGGSRARSVRFAAEADRHVGALAGLRYRGRPDPARHAYHRVMWLKYARAARYPWLPVAPDPPEPR